MCCPDSAQRHTLASLMQQQQFSALTSKLAAADAQTTHMKLASAKSHVAKSE
jgi:hypothetical protein